MKKSKFKKLVRRVVKDMRERGVYVSAKTNSYFFNPKQEPAKFTPPRSLDLSTALAANMLIDWEMERQMLLDSYPALAEAHAKRMAELFDKEKVDRLSRKEK